MLLGVVVEIADIDATESSALSIFLLILFTVKIVQSIVC